jgi:hypothetical protein
MERRDGNVRLSDLAEAVGVERRTLDRIALERDIPRLKYAGDRRTWVSEAAMRAALDEPQRRPGRKPRAGGQQRDGAGRFSTEYPRG